MRVLVLAALALLALPAASLVQPPSALPEAEPAELSHGFFTPYMHAAALDIPRGIRPGAWLEIGAANCTAAFVVRDAAGALYITTAGHCTEALGQRVAVVEGGLAAPLAERYAFGSVVARPQGLDAALIRIDADKYDRVDPRMTGWGGPTGVATTEPPLGTTVKHYGWGWATWYDFSTRCRSGVLSDWTSSTWWYLGLGGGGDSGSAVMTADGKALGILDWGGIAVPTIVTTAFVSFEQGGVRFDSALAAFRSLGYDVSLVEGGPVNPVCVPEPDLP